MRRPIAIALSPNTQREDVLLALRLLLTPWNFFWGDAQALLEQWFRQFFNVSYAVSFSSGRAALFAILKGLGIGEGDEVLLQAFTCAVVPNMVIALGARPVYVDITQKLTLNPLDLKKKLSQRSKAVIVQHTFGVPADMQNILTLAKNYRIDVIEDVAHTIGGTYKGKKLGSFGKASFFSFGRDKAFSSVFGGVAITNDPVLGRKLLLFQKRLALPSPFWVAQQLFHPVAFALILPLYNTWSLGKMLLVLFQKLHLLSFPVTKKEEEGRIDATFLKKLPHALAHLALMQLKKVETFNKGREEIAKLYREALTTDGVVVPVWQTIPFLRFPLLVKRRDEVLAYFKKHGVYLGNWYAEIVDPKGVDLEKVHYTKGSCPNAEAIAQTILNLPTYPTMSYVDAKKVVRLFKAYGKGARDHR